MAKRALITGITGQDGSYLAELLLDKGYDVVGISRRSTSYHHENIGHLAGRIALEYGDLMDGPSVERVVAEYQPDEVYNLAAQSVPADSWNQPVVTAEITAVGTTRMLEAVKRYCPAARFYQASSREIYGAADDEVIDESTPLGANNPYGVAKLYAHQMTNTYRESYDLFACGGVLFNHESPRRGLHFVSRKVTMAVACLKTDTPQVPLNEAGQPLVSDGKLQMGNLDAVRDWGYAREYVEAMWLMMQQDEPANYVIATNTAYTIRELCDVAFGHAGMNWEDHVVTDERFLRPTEIGASRGDYSKAKSELGWEPKTMFAELIRLMVDADIDSFLRPDPIQSHLYSTPGRAP